MIDVELYAALAVATSRYAADAWDRPEAPRTAPPGEAEPLRAKAGQTISGHQLSTFKRACDSLESLGLVFYSDGFGRGSNFTLLVDGADIPKFIRQRFAANLNVAPPLDEVLAAFVGCAEHFSEITSWRVPFRIHDDLRAVLKLLEKAHYVELTREGALWTDKIGPAMRKALLWNEQNISYDEAEQRDREVAMELAFQTIPDDVRQLALKGDVLGLTMAIAALWTGENWLPQPDDEMVDFSDIRAAKYLMDLILKREGKGL
jgi:hypothetical protein